MFVSVPVVAGRLARAFYVGVLVLALLLLPGCQLALLPGLLLALVMLLLGGWHWRHRLQPVQLQLLPALRIGTADGRLWQPVQPLQLLVSPLYLACCCRAGEQQRWLGVFVDQVPEPVFRQLSVRLRLGAVELD